MGTIFAGAIRAKGAWIAHASAQACRRPGEAQAELLKAILRRNRDTRYGRECGFGDIADPGAFRRRVAINTFECLAPYVEAMKRGEPNVLTAEPPVMFNVTSGTTATPKYVPLTRRGMRLAADVSTQWLYHALKDHPRLLDRSILCVTGSAIEGQTEGGIPYGSASGMIYRTLPHILKGTFALPFTVAEINAYPLRYYVMARLAMEREVSFIATPNPLTLLKIIEVGNRHVEEIVRSIHDGRVYRTPPADGAGHDPSVLRAIAERLRPNPTRARALSGMLNGRDRLSPLDYWPSLKLIACWLGGSMGYHAPRLTEYFGKTVPKRDIGYLASEGSMTLPDQDETPAGVLALFNNFYEFIPEAAPDSAPAETRLAHEVEIGRRYRVLLTNDNGLYRYDMCDIVEVVGFRHQAPLIRFVQKDADMTDICGEKLHLNHFIEMFRDLQVTHGIAVSHFRVVPDPDRLRYEFLARIPAHDRAMRDGATLLARMDHALIAANVEYDSRRRSGRLRGPRLHLMDDHWEEAVHRQFLESGRRDIQYKWRVVAKEITDLDRGHMLTTVTMGEES